MIYYVILLIHITVKHPGMTKSGFIYIRWCSTGYDFFSLQQRNFPWENCVPAVEKVSPLHTGSCYCSETRRIGSICVVMSVVKYIVGQYFELHYIVLLVAFLSWKLKSVSWSRDMNICIMFLV